MPKKRRNNGRALHGRGHVKPVHCTNCGRLVAKDKAVKRYTVRNMVDASSLRDIKENKAFETFNVPKFYIKLEYCISCAIHARIVKVRSVENRKIREPPKRVFKKEDDRRPKAPQPPVAQAT
jgi:small subunit ribosomal protein S26e